MHTHTQQAFFKNPIEVIVEIKYKYQQIKLALQKNK